MLQGNVTSPASTALDISRGPFTGRGQRQVAGLDETFVSLFMSLLRCP